jgi:hypothetical protein
VQAYIRVAGPHILPDMRVLPHPISEERLEPPGLLQVGFRRDRIGFSRNLQDTGPLKQAADGCSPSETGVIATGTVDAKAKHGKAKRVRVFLRWENEGEA